MKELFLKIKLMLISLSLVNEVTTKSRYYDSLKKHNIRLFESNWLTYVVWDNKVILKSIQQRFKVIYSPKRDTLIFKICVSPKEGNKVYELRKDTLFYVENLSGFEDYFHIEEKSLLLLCDESWRSRVYDYENQKILIDEESPVYWLSEAKLFMKKTGSYLQLIFPKSVDGYTIWEERKDFIFSDTPKDILKPQLIGEKVLILTKEDAEILDEFDEVEEAYWLPGPYTHLAKEDGCLYIIGITSDDYECLEIDGDDVKPLAPEIPELQNYFVVQKENHLVTIVKYDEEDDFITDIETFQGIDIKVSKPELNIKAGCITIPLKVLEERFLNE